MKYPLASNSWDSSEIDSINRVIESDRYTMGTEVAEFERQFADYFQVKHAVMTNSGSSANLITIATLALHSKFKNRGNIIVPAVSWSTTYFPIHQWGYTLRFVDVDPYTFNIDIKQVEAAMDENTAAVFTVNLLGSPSNLFELSRLCKKNNVTLVEDNCESLGATLNQKFCGTHGHMGTFSFFFSHHMQTMEGGMVVTDDDDLVDYLRSLRAHGWVRDIGNDSSLYKKTGDPFEDSFRFVLPGYCVRPLEMSGAIGQAQLKKLSRMVSMRRDNAEVAKRVFRDFNNIRLQHDIGNSSWFGFGLVCQNEWIGRRKEILTKLNDAGVETRPIVAGNFMRNPVINLLNWEGTGPFTGADDLHDNGFFIGNDGKDLTNEIEYVGDILRSFND